MSDGPAFTTPIVTETVAPRGLLRHIEQHLGKKIAILVEVDLPNAGTTSVTGVSDGVRVVLQIPPGCTDCDWLRQSSVAEFVVQVDKSDSTKMTVCECHGVSKDVNTPLWNETIAAAHTHLFAELFGCCVIPGPPTSASSHPPQTLSTGSTNPIQTTSDREKKA